MKGATTPGYERVAPYSFQKTNPCSLSRKTVHITFKFGEEIQIHNPPGHPTIKKNLMVIPKFTHKCFETGVLLIKHIEMNHVARHISVFPTNIYVTRFFCLPIPKINHIGTCLTYISCAICSVWFECFKHFQGM